MTDSNAITMNQIARGVKRNPADIEPSDQVSPAWTSQDDESAARLGLQEASALARLRNCSGCYYSLPSPSSGLSDFDEP